jgi:hypothetical protein
MSFALPENSRQNELANADNALLKFDVGNLSKFVPKLAIWPVTGFLLQS